MFLSKNWLSTYTNIPENFDVFTELSLHTSEVEAVTEIGKLPHVVIGLVKELTQHPNADRLRVAQVDTGEGALRTIVCGAPNIATGQKVPVAMPGAEMPAGFTIKESELRGVLSQGMICSEDELGLIEERQDGIWVLPEDAPIGELLETWLDRRDSVFEIENKSITNRPDLFGHYGIARELAALTGSPLQPFLKSAALPETDHLPALNITIEEPEACQRYIGLVIENIRPKTSPAWLINRLAAAGVRSHNSIVDVTNYVMMDLGQPMHAFDYDMIKDDDIEIGYMKQAEMPLQTLDGEDRRVEQRVLLIKNQGKPVALAGIMGLANSAISDTTSTILLESATFDKSVIRKGEGLVNLRTDASIRFEKGLAAEHAYLGMLKALELLAEIHPEMRLASKLTDVSSQATEELVITTSWSFLLGRVGDPALDETKAQKILESVGFTMKSEGEKLLVTVPFWRATGDCSIAEDLVEELSRLYGLNNITPTIPEMPLLTGEDIPERLFISKMREELGVHQHLREVHNYAFHSKALQAEFLLQEGIHASPVHVLNPLSSEAEIMRTSILPILAKGAAKFARLEKQTGVFEIEKVYRKENGKVYNDEGMHSFEDMVAGIFLIGDAPANEQHKTQWEKHAFFHAKMILEETLTRLSITGWKLVTPTEDDLAIYPWAHPKQALSLKVRGKTVGLVGGLHPSILRSCDIEDRSSAAAEFSIAPLLPCVIDKTLNPYSEFPSMQRDISFVMAYDAPIAPIMQLARQSSELVSDVAMTDVYQGSNLGEELKSVTLSVTFTHLERTLSTPEVDAIVEHLIQKADKLGAHVRTA